MKFSELPKIQKADYTISDDDTAKLGSSLGYGVEMLVITPDMLRALQEAKIIVADVQGEYGLVVKLSDTKDESKEEG